MKREYTLQQIVNSWVDMTILGGNCSRQVFAAGFYLNELAYDIPEDAWIAICMIIEILVDQNLIDETENESKILASNLGAGPLETLMSQHGEAFIERVEQRAKSDGRMVWILGNVWNNAMPAQSGEGYAGLREGFFYKILK